MFRSSMAAILMATSIAQEAAEEQPRNDRATGGYLVENTELNMRYIPEEDQVEITVTMQDNSWFGIVLGQRDMSRDGDMMVFFADGQNSEYADYHSVGYMAPEQDFEQNLEPHP